MAFIPDWDGDACHRAHPVDTACCSHVLCCTVERLGASRPVGSLNCCLLFLPKLPMLALQHNVKLQLTYLDLEGQTGTKVSKIELVPA